MTILPVHKGRFTARFAETAEDIARAQRLRYLAFVAARLPAGEAPAADARDADDFDTRCRHVLVEDRAGGTLVCCFRILPLARGAEIARSYSAQFYELGGLCDYPGRMVEMGRFCLHPAWHDPEILRLAWAAMTRIVDAGGVEMLFGCSSFTGRAARAGMDAFALLRERHLAPRRWLPRVKAPAVFRFGRLLRRWKADPRRAMLGMPPLLRSYLMLGGWVSDHAVVDRDLGTLHVFTGLEIKAIPPARARLLRADAS
ncbi:MAG: GNAT family N-acetyltransferase [Rhodobacteraceae bacterium]|nr:GNAT family N-acetyltransferase [Paracoccaceae bacterium]